MTQIKAGAATAALFLVIIGGFIITIVSAIGDDDIFGRGPQDWIQISGYAAAAIAVGRYLQATWGKGWEQKNIEVGAATAGGYLVALGTLVVAVVTEIGNFVPWGVNSEGWASVTLIATALVSGGRYLQATFKRD